MNLHLSRHPLKVLRRERGVTRETLAELVGRTALTIGKYERWEKCPPPEVIEVLVDWSEGRLSLADFVLPARRIHPKSAGGPTLHTAASDTAPPDGGCSQ